MKSILEAAEKHFTGRLHPAVSILVNMEEISLTNAMIMCSLPQHMQPAFIDRAMKYNYKWLEKEVKIALG